MKALTIRQPWASLIAHGVKTIETRSWSTKYRGPLAIHAGRARPPVIDFGRWSVPPVVDALCEWGQEGERPLLRRIDMPLGAVVTTCTLADVVPMVAPGHVPPVNVATGEGRSILIHPDGSLWGNHCPDTTVFDWQDLTDQLPFGDFTPGRWAYLLDRIEPVDPIPCRGKQGLWTLPSDIEEKLRGLQENREVL